MRLTEVLCAAVLPLAAAAQADQEAMERAERSKRQTMAALTVRARAITDAAADEMNNWDRWQEIAGRRREEMRDMLGLLPWPERTKLNARITGKLDKGSYWIEKLAFESLPRIYVTGNLYIPKNLSGRAPAIVYVCGHAYSPYGDKAKYQRHGISFARNGYVALILDSIQIAETFALHHGVYNQEMYEWYARGYTPAGVEVWNAMRAIDYLEARAEVDPERIGMTGRSGGAAMTWFTAAVDPRVKAAVPVMGISTYAANLAENTQRLHCDCMFAINTHRHDMLHQGALIAPRPLLMMHGRKDALFPVAGYEEFEQRIGALFQSAGNAAAFRNVVVETGHQDSEFLREQAIRWFDHHLMGIGERKLDLDYSDAPEESLAVFPEGPPADAQNHRVHETFIQTPEFREFRSLAGWQTRRTQLLDVLGQRIFQDLPKGLGPVAFQVEPHKEGQYFDNLTFESEPGVEIRALIRTPGKQEHRLPALLYVASDGEDPEAIRHMLSTPRGQDGAVRMVVYPRGVGEVPWEKSFWKAVLRNAMHVGHTVDSLRLWDVLRAIQLLQGVDVVDAGRITVMGSGISAGLALYASILDSSVHQALLMNPPESHVEGPIFLNILRHTDLPEAAALLAPRRLNFYSRMPAAFSPVKSVYALYGHPEHVHVTMDMQAVVEGRYDHDFASGQ